MDKITYKCQMSMLTEGAQGRVGPDRGGAAQPERADHLPGLPGRGPQHCALGEPAGLLRHRRAVPGPVPGRPGRTHAQRRRPVVGADHVMLSCVGDFVVEVS